MVYCLNGEIDTFGIFPLRYVSASENMLTVGKSYLGRGNGFVFTHLEYPGDIPAGFAYATGFMTYRYDTLTITLFSYQSSSLALNSCQWIPSTGEYIWRGWKTL